MKDIRSFQDELIENFHFLEEWEDKYEYLMDFSLDVDALSDRDKSDVNLVQGCQSKLWLISSFKNGRVWYKSDGESPIPKGIAAILVKLLSGNEPTIILQTNIDFHSEAGLINYLSPARVKGIESMILRFKSLAAQYLKQD